MELNEIEKRLLFQVEGDYQSKVLNELYMTTRYTKNPEQRKAAENLMAKLRILTDAECMDIVRDIQKNYRLPYPLRTIGEKIAGSVPTHCKRKRRNIPGTIRTGWGLLRRRQSCSIPRRSAPLPGCWRSISSPCMTCALTMIRITG